MEICDSSFNGNGDGNGRAHTPAPMENMKKQRDERQTTGKPKERKLETARILATAHKSLISFEGEF